jgi:MoxR-like ATPase
VTQEYKITGFIDAHGNYHETEFYKAFKNGGVFMLDEIDASIPEVLVILNAGIANRYFEFPNGRINAHKDFRVISAGNTFGTGADADYVGRYQLDGATLDRFALVKIDYSPRIEKAIANNDSELLDFIHSLRKAVYVMGLRHIVSYRGTGMVAKLVQTDMDIEKVLSITIMKGLHKDDIKQIQGRLNVTNKYTRALEKLSA